MASVVAATAEPAAVAVAAAGSHRLAPAARFLVRGYIWAIAPARAFHRSVFVVREVAQQITSPPTLIAILSGQTQQVIARPATVRQVVPVRRWVVPQEIEYLVVAERGLSQQLRAPLEQQANRKRVPQGIFQLFHAVFGENVSPSRKGTWSAMSRLLDGPSKAAAPEGR